FSPPDLPTSGDLPVAPPSACAAKAKHIPTLHLLRDDSRRVDGSVGPIFQPLDNRWQETCGAYPLQSLVEEAELAAAAGRLEHIDRPAGSTGLAGHVHRICRHDQPVGGS